MNRKLTKSQAPNIIPAQESESDFPEMRNAFRARLMPVFKLPVPLNDWMFRLVVRRFLPWMKTGRLTPLRMVNEESVCGSVGSFYSKRKLTAKQRVQLSVQAAAEMGLLFHLPAGRKRSLERIDIQFLLPVSDTFVTRCEWQAVEVKQLQNPNGRIFKGAAIVNEKNELVAKAVTEWTWSTEK